MDPSHLLSEAARQYETAPLARSGGKKSLRAALALLGTVEHRAPQRQHWGK